jgi:2-oxoisovalerate dehydrogenase E2 component (dihydrolipoyl transacylase)
VELLQWFVRPGDHIRQFDKVCEVQSDKATVEITSRYDGKVAALRHQVGSMVSTGSVLLDIIPHVDSEAPSASLTTGSALPSPLSVPHNLPLPNPGVGGAFSSSLPTLNGAASASRPPVLTVPSVRRLAKEHGIDLAAVVGKSLIPTGPGGRVLKGDVLAYLATVGKFAPPLSRLEMPCSPVAEFPSSPASPSPLIERVPLKGIQKAMAKQMQAALAIPHMVYCDEVAMDRVKLVRDELRAVFAERKGGSERVKLSYMPLIIKAASMALSQFPLMNASTTNCMTEVLIHRNHNIGVAMDTPKGLVVPCIRDVQDLSIIDIALQLNSLQERGAAGKLSETDLTGATFTLSNIGSIGGTYASPVIVPPQVAIGALGRIQTIPRFSDSGEVIPVSLMAISLSGDHRVIDGGTMARFCNAWRSYLERPSTMLAEIR